MHMWIMEVEIPRGRADTHRVRNVHRVLQYCIFLAIVFTLQYEAPELA